jgi:hypothetical protein
MGRHPMAVPNLHITYARTMKVDYSRFSSGKATWEACSGNWERKNGNHPSIWSRSIVESIVIRIDRNLFVFINFFSKTVVNKYFNVNTDTLQKVTRVQGVRSRGIKNTRLCFSTLNLYEICFQQCTE